MENVDFVKNIPSEGSRRRFPMGVVANGVVTSVDAEDNDSHESSSSFYSTQSNKLSAAANGRKQKIQAIREAARMKELASLRQFAINRGGLLSDEIRKEVWPLMVNVDLSDLEVNHPATPETVEYWNTDAEQVRLDVERTLARFPPNMSNEERLALQKKLIRVICRILNEDKTYRYYQGFHDVCLTMLLVFGRSEPTFRVGAQLAATYFRPFLTGNLEICQQQLELMYPLISSIDPDLDKFMCEAETGVMFALSFHLTWFSHSLDDVRTIVRLFDLFIAAHPLMPVYLTAAIVMMRSNEVLNTECDMPFIHALLSKIPPTLPWESLISDATDLFLRFPPHKLMDMWADRKALTKRRNGRPLARRRRHGGQRNPVLFTVWFVAGFGVAAWFTYLRYGFYELFHR